MHMGDEFIRAPKRGAKNVPKVEEGSGKTTRRRRRFTDAFVFVRENHASGSFEFKTLARDLVHVRSVGPELRPNAKLGVLGGYRERICDDCADDCNDDWSDVRFEQVWRIAVGVRVDWVDI
jgi:hypothetical protein